MRHECVPALRMLATSCGGVRAGERALVVTDTAADQDVVAALGIVLATLGASVEVVSSVPADLPGDDPPPAVQGAMRAADVIFELTSTFIGSCQARRDACAAGARYLTCPGLNWQTLRPGGPFAVDFDAIGAHARRLAALFDDAREFQLTSDAGTDLRGSFAGRKGRPLWGVATEPGGYAAPPDVEVGASPVEGTAHGVVVIDGSLLFLGPDQLAAPVELHFEAGRLVDVRGRDAWRLRDAVARAGDPRQDVLAEVSIGLNPHSRPGGAPLELEGIVGGAHVAVGNNVAYGGTNDARSHIDCVMLAATLALDGVPVDPAVVSSLVDEVLAFAAIPAPTFHEEGRLAWLEERLRDRPGTLERDRVGNLIWRVGDGPLALAVLAHVDTVFPEETPLSFERAGGRLTGPGIGDNAAAVVTTLHAMDALLARGLGAQAAVAFTVGEEGLGNLVGAHAACEGLAPPQVLVVEGHGLEEVLVDAVGSLRARVRVTGPGGHSWVNRGQPSAIHALLRLGAELVALAGPDEPVNIGLLSGGQTINTLAPAAELTVEQRALDEPSLARFAAALAALSVEAPLTVEVELVGRRPAGRLDRSAPLLATVREVRAGLGLPDALGAGSTDANAALVRGIPALTLGVARGGLMHSADEWLDEGSLALGLAQLESVLGALLPAA